MPTLVNISMSILHFFNTFENNETEIVFIPTYIILSMSTPLLITFTNIYFRWCCVLPVVPYTFLIISYICCHYLGGYFEISENWGMCLYYNNCLAINY